LANSLALDRHHRSLFSLENKRMQIAGSPCIICKQAIVLANEGKFCPRCGTFAHIDCEPRTNCTVCGSSFQEFKPTTPDALQEAIIPAALRASSSGASVVILGGLIIFLIGLAWYILFYFPPGH
jgi:ribosomal protein S27AE